MGIKNPDYTETSTLSTTPTDLKSFENKSDQDIWDDFRSGDRNALIFVYYKYNEDLCRYAYQFTSNKELIKDCIQELFVNLFTRSSYLGPTTSIKFYLYRSIRRLLTQERKREEKLKKHTGGVESMAFLVSLSHESTLIREENHHLQSAQIRWAINQLPIRQREAIFYYFYEGFTYQEIAEILDYKEVKSVRTLVYRAIDSLKKELLGQEKSDNLLWLLFLILLPSL